MNSPNHSTPEKKLTPMELVNEFCESGAQNALIIAGIVLIFGTTFYKICTSKESPLPSVQVPAKVEKAPHAAAESSEDSSQPSQSDEGESIDSK